MRPLERDGVDDPLDGQSGRTVGRIAERWHGGSRGHGFRLDRERLAPGRRAVVGRRGRKLMSCNGVGESCRRRLQRRRRVDDGRVGAL